MHRTRNANTQPFKEMPVFNNWDVVAKAWYVGLPSAQLPAGEARSIDLCGQWVVLYRGMDERVRALDGYCPHMGTDLGIGAVEGNEIRCFFHHWRFDGEGRCSDIPCQADVPTSATLRSYAVEEKYGFIWVYPDRKAVEGVVQHAELEGRELVWTHGKSYERSCHHHVTMINGIDPQHLRTVHGIEIEMEMRVHEDERRGLLDITLSGELPSKKVLHRIARWLLGPRYSYSMRYAHASIGCLTILKGVSWFGKGRPLPELYMIFAYRPLARGRTLVQPIYLTRRRGGIAGWLVARVLMWLTKRAFFALQSEDGMVYENMRFQPRSLLPIDAPVARFIGHVNTLEPSVWSREISGEATKS
jgi:nitrite reductase/ring-hydroxylating ferredoxin subunit